MFTQIVFAGSRDGSFFLNSDSAKPCSYESSFLALGNGYLYIQWLFVHSHHFQPEQHCRSQSHPSHMSFQGQPAGNQSSATGAFRLRCRSQMGLQIGREKFPDRKQFMCGRQGGAGVIVVEDDAGICSVCLSLVSIIMFLFLEWAFVG